MIMESIFDCAKRLEARGVAHKLVIATTESCTVEASDDFETEFESFVEKCRKIVKAAQASYDIRVDSGKRYRRLVRIDNRSEFGSVFCFVDTTNGNVLKADSFKAPAKGARGNIFDEHNGTARAQWTGVR